jgi:AraC-like DNA-binding protein
MNFLQFPPQPMLATLVECFWVAEGSETFSQRIIPDGFCEMIFHYGDPYVQEGVTENIFQPAAIAAGQITRPIHIRPTGISGVLGVKLKPTAFWKLFPCDMGEIRDAAVSLYDVTGLQQEMIVEALKLAATTEERIAIVETFLLSRVRKARTSPVTEAILMEITKSRGQIAVEKLAKNEKISLRKMERVFKETIGVSAKTYARLTRFNHAFKLLQQSHITKAETAYLCGYFDQSHFNRDFKQFSGDDPGTWFGTIHPYADFFLMR